MALSEKEKTQIETDVRQDQRDETTRSYKGDPVTDVVFAPLDLVTGDQSTTEHAAEKQSYYNDVKTSIDSRDK